jgi:hypothetical protein
LYHLGVEGVGLGCCQTFWVIFLPSFLFSPFQNWFPSREYSPGIYFQEERQPNWFEGENLCTTGWGKWKAETDKFNFSCWLFELCHSAQIVHVLIDLDFYIKSPDYINR